MNTLKTELFLNGEKLERDSAKTFAAMVEMLSQVDALFQEYDMAVPTILRDECRAIRSRISNLRADASAVVGDVERFGSMEKALAERSWRKA